MNSSDQDQRTAPAVSSPRVKIRMLQQMAEALEDEASGLYRRAALFEEEEDLLNREIEERRTEINRLMLKLEALRSEREGVIEKIDTLRSEATALREEVSAGEEEAALSAIEGARVEDGLVASGAEFLAASQSGRARNSIYFRRMTLAEHAR